MTHDPHDNSSDKPSPGGKDHTLDFNNEGMAQDPMSGSSEMIAPTMTPAAIMTPHGAGYIAARYEILGLLGSGGMGNVYKVRDIELDEIVALKTLHDTLRENEQALKRFRREVKLARRVTHPNVARTYDLGTDTDTLYLTMEFVQGDTLYTYLHRQRRQQSAPDPIKVIAIICDIARGLEAAHQAGVIHRDLKPANVMLTHDERVVITDFGIARISSVNDAVTARDGMVGTPLYMSPEQVEGHTEIDQRADLYALGVMFYELLTSKPPFEGDSPVALALARILNPAPSLEREPLPAGLATIVASLLERDPALRYPDARALIQDLEQLRASLSREPIAAAPLPGHLPGHTGSTRYLGARPLSSSDQRTIAVFPLQHSAGEQGTYLTEGFAEELVGELSMAPKLRIKPLSAVKTLLAESEEHDPLRVGATLGVDVIITGSVREHQGKLRIRLSLLSVREGFQIWGEKFVSSAAELFVTAEDAAEAIAQALTSEVKDEQRPEALIDPVAVDAYMRGRYLLQLRWFDGVDEALDMFHLARARVPDDPRVLTGLATAMARKVFFEPTQAFLLLQEARLYAQRAIEIVPKWPEPHYAMAMIAYASGDYSSTITWNQRALSLSPEHIEAHDLLGRVLAEVGPLEEASHHLEQALQLNESLYRAWWDLIRVKALQGKWEEVDEMLARSRKLPVLHNANESFLFRLHCWRGRSAESFPDNFIDEERDQRFSIIFETIQLCIKFGTLSEQYIHDMQQMAQHIPAGSQHIRVFLQLNAEFALLSGHHELAYRAIDFALNEGLRDLMWLQHLEPLAPLRDEPRFKAILSRAYKMLSPVRATLTPHTH